jgi:hypothetical protein
LTEGTQQGNCTHIGGMGGMIDFHAFGTPDFLIRKYI